mgnify:CR=1 FL=1
MKTKNILKGLTVILLTLTFGNCTGSYDVDVLEELKIDREFAPVALTARVRNQTTVELNWTVRENVNNFLIEVSADDPSFGTIFKTAEITADQLPYQIALEGETVYSIRVKAISSRGLDDSTYALVTATTLTEQIFLPIQPGDVLAKEATFRWTPNSNVTQISLTPGNIVYNITDQEKIDGIAVVTGLSAETDYTALLLNNAKTRGVLTFTTGIDIGTGILVTPTDDLFQMIADAAPDAILVLEPGDYTAQIGTATIDKSITIRGLRSFDKPLLKISFSIAPGTTNLSLIDLDLTGDVTEQLTDVVEFASAGNYNSLLISGCNIHDYDKSLIKGQTTDVILQTLTVENSVLTNILTNSSDFIDFRDSNVLNVNVTTSTFNNCAPSRDFIRIDNSGTSNGTGLTCNVLIESCTLYKVSNSSSKRIVYVRFDKNEIEIRNTLITDSPDVDAISDRDDTDEDIIFVNNNYFNAPALTDPKEKRYDPTASTFDPGYVDAVNGNFTLTNQTLIDNEVGDPRWRQ